MERIIKNNNKKANVIPETIRDNSFGDAANFSLLNKAIVPENICKKQDKEKSH